MLQFWFGGDGGDGPLCPQFATWFQASDATDRDIDSRFGVTVSAAVAAGAAPWPVKDVPHEDVVAAIVLLDQFPRNLFRGTAKAFSGDTAALGMTLTAIADGWVLDVDPMMAMFVLMPLQHAENEALQHLSVELTRRLADKHPDNALMGSVVEFAEKHRDIIVQFGRFPHRNKVLGRKSTAEEVTYLKDAETFGQ